LENPGIQVRQSSAQEVYDLAAFILQLNGVIGKDEVIMDTDSRPGVTTPFSV
jgi:hypothetical protein